MRVSLEEILLSRDNRQSKQRAFIREYGRPLLSLTIVMPGDIKQNDLTRRISDVATKAIVKEFGESIIVSKEDDLATGFEAFYVVDSDALEAKRRACAIEDTHPWGRLFDIDVIGEDYIPHTRESINVPPRKCLICDMNVHYCIRNRTHSPQDIIRRMEETISMTI